MINEKYLQSQRESNQRMLNCLNSPDQEYAEKDKTGRIIDLVDKLVWMDGSWTPIEKKDLPSLKIFKGHDGKYRMQFLDNLEYFDFKGIEIEPNETDTLLIIKISGSKLELGYHRTNDEIYIGQTFYRRLDQTKPFLY